MSPLDPRVVERLWQKVDNPNGEHGCWLWSAGKNNEGYGYFRYGKRMIRAHRFAYALNKGAITDDLLVLHSCDVPACVASHLRLGVPAPR